MTDKEFIPELHDIGKLVDDKVKDEIKKIIGKSWKSHCFIDFNFQELQNNGYSFTKPSSPSWWGQYHHEIKVYKDIKEWDDIPEKYRYDVFLLILADHIASSISRAISDNNEFEELSNIKLKYNDLFGDSYSDKKDKEYKGIYKLWNTKFYINMEKTGKYWAKFRSINDLKTVFNEIDNCIAGEEFLNKYKENLLLTPEDKSILRNITSLYTHIELVGKIYRILKRNTNFNIESDGSMTVEYEDKKVNTINDAETKWEWRLVKCWIKFPHSFVRLQDINLVKKRKELIEHLTNNFKDEVLFATSDFVMLFLPLNQDLNEIFNKFLDYGFYIEVDEIISKLKLLESTLDKKIHKMRKSNANDIDAKIYKKYLLPDMPNELNPPICDICQQRKGIEREKENIKEWICDKCWEIRNMGDPFEEYAKIWEKEGVKVGWFKFSIDQRKLEEWLIKAFEDYIEWIYPKIFDDVNKRYYSIKSEIDKVEEKQNELKEKEKEQKMLINKVKKGCRTEEVTNRLNELSQEIKNLKNKLKNLKKKIKKLESQENKLKLLKEKINNPNYYIKKTLDEFRPLAPQIDFNKDYEEMLKEFWKKFEDRDDIKKPISDYNELGVFKYSPKLTKEIIETYLEVFNKYFPDVKGDDCCPICLSLSIANIKYPIREHWRFFEKEEKSFLNIRKHNAFIERYTKDDVYKILKVINDIESSSFLYKLVQLDNSLNSEIYLTIEIFNNRKKYPEVHKLFSENIAPSKILNLYRIIGDTNE
ncbi:conserved protein of unknown function [Methanocaldococcus lauensis]|uniref:Uncharacterized protein n=1 Tax=Methanocaldococcus lauensis TaxID=2546128 RepID=A0A8D6PPP4_9EURY|nr:hypothetical protein [Methanocaldococcus lauensis]CAB3287440.1 conserved protein of unknown function [Methanocaldococcus lauensis]